MSYLNRFTTVPILFDMIIRKHLVLMDPALWEDKNDSELLLEYKKRKDAQKLFAACFSCGGETIHHWKAFAGGPDGCCIEFDKERFINHVSRFDGIRCAHVEYKRIKEVDPKHIDVEMIPFIKRWPYQCEEEYRIIWVGRTNLPWHEIPIDLRHIRKITLSQKMPPHVFDATRDHLREMLKNPKFKVNHSTIYSNRTWINKFTEA